MPFLTDARAPTAGAAVPRGAARLSAAEPSNARPHPARPAPVQRVTMADSPAAAERGGATERSAALWRSVALSYAYVALWIALSGTVIMYNKYILAYSGFAYPVALTMWCAPRRARTRRTRGADRTCRNLFACSRARVCPTLRRHMFFCSVLAVGLVKSGRVAACEMMLTETYLKAIVPIGACYAATLWVGNAAYLYLSVSFIQMLKALMPVAVFSAGCLFGTNRFDWATMANMLLVTAGVAVASYGELAFDATGVAYQLVAIALESVRLVLVQILLQSRGLKLNPITTLYYVAPCCLAFLTVPFFSIEYARLAADANVVINPAVFLSNALAAFGLNMAVFLLIGKTSALTMNIAGVAKDWMLIGLSVAVFRSAISQLNLLGYMVAFTGVCWYNFQKLRAMQKPDSPRAAGAKAGGAKGAAAAAADKLLKAALVGEAEKQQRD
jgi:hypothetical protein